MAERELPQPARDADQGGSTSGDVPDCGSGALPVPPECRPEPCPVGLDDLPALTAAHPVLISDDDSDLLLLFKLVLERAGLTVVATPLAKSALYVCQAAPISLLATDIMKPEMSGFELLVRLQTDPATKGIPVLFVSACREDQVTDRAMRLGAQGYLAKPVAVSDYLDTVQRLLVERGHWQRPPAFDPAVLAALTRTDVQYATAPGLVRVMTTRAAQ
jgi:two-component system cell cycle response regulator DivK